MEYISVSCINNQAASIFLDRNRLQWEVQDEMIQESVSGCMKIKNGSFCMHQEETASRETIKKEEVSRAALVMPLLLWSSIEVKMVSIQLEY